MKKIVLFILLFCSTLGFGQTYQLLPDSCTICVFTTNQGVSQNYAVHPNQDTLVMGNIYMMRKQSYNLAGTGELFAFRQEGNQVKGIIHDSISEYLIMDFDAQVGDTIYNLFSDGVFYHARVEAKDSFQLTSGVFIDYTFLYGLKYSSSINGPWQDLGWVPIQWNERGLCSEYGGLLYNLVNHFLIDIFYWYPNYATSDPLYPGNPSLTYDNCVLDYNSIAELNQIKFNLFPNPTSDILHVSFSNMSMKNISIYDTFGQLIETISTSESTIEINSSNFANGIYFVKVSGENSESTKLVVKN